MDYDQEGLSWLHDCSVLSLTSEFRRNKRPSLDLVIQCPDDLGYEKWNDKILHIKAEDIAVMKWLSWNYMLNDNVDAVRDSISSREILNQMERGRKLGAKFPSINLTILFTSGSSIELSCKALSVTIL